MSSAERIVRPTKAELAEAIALRLLETISEALEARGVAHVVLTGGSMGSATLAALGTLIEKGGATDLAWSDVHLWWGDERFLPEGDAERNVVQAREALLDQLQPQPQLHVMAASDTAPIEGVAAAADRYANELNDAFGAGFERSGEPVFDLVMLGMGPDTHVASLFPGHPQTRIDNAVTVAVDNSPKPPPERISLSFPALNSTRQTWLMIAGGDKAQAVRDASTSQDRTAHPASGVRGRDATIWWLDDAAAN